MTKREDYRQQLRSSDDWDALLQQKSGLPGPRANLELAYATTLEGDAKRFYAWVRLDSVAAPENTPPVFLVVCGLLGLGRLLAEGQREVLGILRSSASDSRWRVREGVAMALQTWGDIDMQALLTTMQAWSTGTLYEQRAVVAALCEPRLLREPAQAEAVIPILDGMTASFVAHCRESGDERAALHKALSYGWSVAIVACPAPGKAAFTWWADLSDRISAESYGRIWGRAVSSAWIQAGSRIYANR